MEKIGSFVVEASPKRGFDHVLDEIKADAELFPEQLQKIIKKIDSGETLTSVLTEEEQKQFNTAKKEWWQNKYGFPYADVAARGELLMRKYALPAELEEAHKLQEALLSAFKREDESGIAELRAKYLDKHPDQLEGVEALFGLTQYFENDEGIQAARLFGIAEEKKKSRLQSLTEYNFLLSDFIRANSADKEFLRTFWSVLEMVARKTGHLVEFQRLQRAIVTQVATGKIFEQLGMHPQLSHPSEDAFKAIDLWTDGAAVQIKGTGNSEMGFLKTDEISFPGIQITQKEKDQQAKTYHINSETFQKAQKFHAKLSQYRKVIKKDVEGYFLVVPYNKIDFITGEPAPDLVEFAREQVKTTLK